MVRDTLKICRLCKEAKPLNCFYKHKNTKDRLRNECISCVNIKTMQYYLANKGYINHKQREYHFRTKYGLSIEDLDNLKKEQKICAACGKDKPLVVDHDHKTGIVRGLLCVKCNQGLGCFEDDPLALRGAAAYLENLYAEQERGPQTH